VYFVAPAMIATSPLVIASGAKQSPGSRALEAMIGRMRMNRLAIAALMGTTAIVPRTASPADASDHRIHISRGAVSSSDPIVLTPEGAKVELVASFSMAAAAFVPDPYAGKCRFIAVKYTLKKDDQKLILGDAYKESDPDDPLVLHADELRNAAGRLGADTIYLLLNDSDALDGVKGLHDCRILGDDSGRPRGEEMREVSCQDPAGKTLRFSEYAARASFYACGAKGEKK
jgi:hypothetical protein